MMIMKSPMQTKMMTWNQTKSHSKCHNSMCLDPQLELNNQCLNSIEISFKTKTQEISLKIFKIN